MNTILRTRMSVGVPLRGRVLSVLLLGFVGLLTGCGLLAPPSSSPYPAPDPDPASDGPRPSPTEPSAGAGEPGPWFEGEILVGYRDAAALRAIVTRLGGAVVETIPRIRAALVALPPGMSVPQAVRELTLSKPPGLRYAEPNYIRTLIKPEPGLTWPDPGEVVARGSISAAQRRVFDDPLRPRQYALDVMRAEEAWAIATGRGVILGVVDTGMDGTHPELKGKQLEGLSCWDEVPLLPDEDGSQGEDAHATHVAGIAAARGGNGEGIVGVAPEAKIMSLRIFDARRVRPGNSSGYVGDARVARCIVWASTVGPDGVENSGDEAHVLNNSWGGRGYSQTLKEAIDVAVEHGVTFVNSMGNSSEDEVLYPKNYPGVLAVGATDPWDRKADFSTMGGAISVGAPGVDVLSSVPLWIERPTGEPYGYMYFSGTSMAAPQVSGAVALLKERFPEATPYQLQRALEMTADDVEGPGFDRLTGYGRVNLARALGLPELPPDGAEVVIKVLTKNPGLGGEPVGVPFVDVILRQGGKERYFAQTNAEGVARFLNVRPGEYEVLASGGDATIYRFRVANRLSARGRVVARSGERSEIEFRFSTSLRVTLRWEEPVDIDLWVGEPQPERSDPETGEVLSEWADPKGTNPARWGRFSGDDRGAGAGPYQETYTLREEHFPYAPYPIAISAENATQSARVTVIVEQNGITEVYGPYRVEPGEVLPSWEWPDWWENTPKPEMDFEEPGPGAPWVY